MKKIYKLGIIGAGFMANAIIDGVFNSNTLTKDDIICSCKTDETLEKLKIKGINVSLNNKYIVENSEFVLFAIKPQSLQAVLEEISSSKLDKCISILAGTKKEKFKKIFNNVKVARCMPNTPCSINCGAMGIDLSDYDNKEDINFINNIFSPLGKLVNVNEEKLNAVTGVSGSSPAYFFYFAKSLIDAGIKQGLTEEESKILVINTMLGSSQMLLNSNKSIDELINSVCSKGGTTIQAMNVFEKNKLEQIVDEAVVACVKRSKEIEEL